MHQRIRAPFEIFQDPREGTCLDLALVFCSLCLGFDLLPILIITDGHALAAVSLTHGRDELSARTRREYHEFKKGILTDAKLLFDLIDVEKRYLAIECTGFARCSVLPENCPEGKGRTAEGYLPFKDAVRAGRRQLDHVERSFMFALDIAVAHKIWGIRVEDIPPRRGAPWKSSLAPPRLAGKHLHCLSNRTRQAEQILAELDKIALDLEPRPLVCVLDGDQEQGHEYFIDRLESFDLPRWLPRQTDRAPVLRAFVPMPARFTRPVQFENDLWTALANSVVNPRGEPDGLSAPRTFSPDSIVVSPRVAARKRLSAYPGPVLISTDFSADDWGPQGRSKIEGFLDFWEQFTPLTAERRLIVCLCIKYRYSFSSRLGWLSFPLRRDPNRELQTYLDQLCEDFGKWTRVRCVKPDRLVNIPLKDALALDELAVIRQHCYGVSLEPSLKQLYERYGTRSAENGIPMEAMAKNLLVILRKQGGVHT
jgi:hypothetical protein